jgi:hypothetical protein
LGAARLFDCRRVLQRIGTVVFLAVWQRFRRNAKGRSPWRILIRRTTLTITVAVLLGATAGQLLVSAGDNDQIVVGNTGGTLSSIIRVDNALIVFGGGNARSDLADLLGRSTLPWKRQVDLLVIPGWDSQQALGALGLLERQDVKQIVILGQPSTETVWTVLYQRASSRAIPVNVASNRSRIDIDSDVHLELTASDTLSSDSAEFALLTLQFHAVQLSFLDASKDGIDVLKSAGAMPIRTHALVLSRAATNLATRSTLRVQPSVARSDDFDLASSNYQRELDSGERITVDLAPNELRLSLDAVQFSGATPAASPTAG